MKYIVRNAGNRNIDHLKEAIPGLIVIHNEINAMEAFVDALKAAGDDAAVHLEDDILLCPDFVNTLEETIRTHKAKNEVVQFFSMRKDDLTIGTRYIPGARFLMGQCFYLPAGMSKDILAYKETWKRIEEHPTGLDLMVADYLKDNKRKYLNVVPNLVEHMVGKSIIDKRRSSKRQSFTFGNKHLKGVK